MKIRAFTLICLLLCLSCAADDKAGVYWQKGNQFYSQKAYDSAAACFELIAAQKPVNAVLYYNLGNTYYRLNRIGPAVLNYERCLNIDPQFRDAKENLLLTETRISNHIQTVSDIFFIKWWNSLTHPVKAAAWSVSALVVFVLACVILLIRKINKTQTKFLPVQVVYVLGFVWCILITLAIVASNKQMRNVGAVVMQNDTPLLNNELHGKPITQLPEGTVVTILEEKDMWVNVRISDGRSGWVQNTLIEKI